MKIWISSYTLKPKSTLGLSAKIRCGALLKIQDEQLGMGFADLHPWEELGDASLEKQCKVLQSDTPTALGERALFFARIDAAARHAKRSVFADLTIPASHRLIGDISKVTPHLLYDVESEGFRAVKIKIPRDLLETLPTLEAIVAGGKDSRVFLRLDFNSQHSKRAVHAFLKEASESLKDRIEFIEDPFRYNGEEWEALSQTYGVGVARDHGAERGEFAGCRTIVMKPAVMNPIPVMGIAARRQKRVVFTSVLGHPLGQLSAAYAAAIASRNFPGIVDICGLLGHELYETNVFSEQLRHEQSVLIPPEGTGFGFDDELQKLSWECLKS